MKKIVGILAASAVAASAFAVDFASTMRIDGKLLDAPKDGDVSILQVNPGEIKDDDLFTFNVENDNAGVHFRFWSMSDDTGITFPQEDDQPEAETAYLTMTGVDAEGNPISKYIPLEDGAIAIGNNGLQLRKAHIWWKPFDMLKVNVGYTHTATFCEELHWWKDPTGAAWNEWGEDTEFDDAASVDGVGYELTLTPIDGLTISGGVMPGYKNFFMTFDGNGYYSAYGVQAKYEGIYAGDFNISIGAGWRDFGKTEDGNGVKIASLGVGIANADGLSGFVNGRFHIAEDALDGIAIDDYFGIPVGPANIQLCVPVVVRLTGKKGDESYIRPDLKVSLPSVAESNWTPYVEAECNSITFADKGFHGMLIKAGADYSNGAFTAKPSLNVTFDANGYSGISIPVEFYFAL